MLQRKRPRHFATHVAPIYPDISDEDGVNLMDCCVRIESYNSDVKLVESKIGVSLSELPQLNRRSKEVNFRNYFTKKSLALFEDIYRQDVEKLGYEY